MQATDIACRLWPQAWLNIDRIDSKHDVLVKRKGCIAPLRKTSQGWYSVTNLWTQRLK